MTSSEASARVIGMILGLTDNGRFPTIHDLRRLREAALEAERLQHEATIEACRRAEESNRRLAEFIERTSSRGDAPLPA